MSDAHRFCVAPMIRLTDRHARYFLRQLSRRARLYTEMITTGALLHGPRERLLDFDAAEHPLALQLGGSEPEALARCARIGEDWGYDEINLNVGCPSNRVQSGRFGACLMAEPQRVADCVAAMRAACTVPVTVKTRLGIDELDDYAHLHRFVSRVAAAGCDTFIVHARKAWLAGLSPKQNREIPPLHYDRVHRLKRDFPGLAVVLNGGLQDLEAATGQLQQVDGVMLGRAAYANPWLLAGVDARLFGDPYRPCSREAVVHAMLDYLRRQQPRGTALSSVTRHMLGLYNGRPGARRWRRILSQQAVRPGAGCEVLESALAAVAPMRAAA